MLRSLVTIACVAAIVVLSPRAAGQAYTGYFEVPIEWVLHDAEYHDGFLWVMHRSAATPRILQIDPEDGQLVGTLDLNIEFTPAGLAWDGEHFWISSTQAGVPARLYRIDADGNVLLDIPGPNTTSANGLGWHDGDFWVSRAQPSDAAAHVRVAPADGTELEAVSAPWAQPAGMAFLGDGTFWATNTGVGASPEKLYHLDRTTGELLQELDMPAGIGRPRGLAYDGQQYLYMVAHTRPGPVHYRIYVVDLLAEGSPELLYEPSPLDFGLVVTDAPVTLAITLSNLGDGDLVIDTVGLSGSDAFSTAFEGAVVAPDGEAEVAITFAPESYGPESGLLTFSTNDIDELSVAIPLEGHGLHPQQTLATTASSHHFGEVRIEEPYGRAVRTWPMAIVNQGAEPLTVSSVALEAPFTIEQAIDYPLAIVPADTVRVLLGFRPTETGTFEGQAVITADDPQQPTHTVALAGIGVDPEVGGGEPLWSLFIPDNPATSFQNRKIHAIRPLDDVTGDGTPNVVVGTRNYWVMALRGNAWQNGEILWRFNTCPSSDNCGTVSGNDGLFHTGMVAGADLNGDGFRDVVVGTGGGNDHVYALSAVDGSVIWAHGDENDPFLGSYNAVDARFDFDGDGVPDVVAGTGSASGGSPNPYNQRRVYLLSGATGEVVWVRQPNQNVPVFSVAQVLGSDGGPRVVAGGHNPAAGQGFVVAYDQNGDLLWNQPVSFSPFLILPLERPDGEGEDVVFTGSSTSNALVKLDGDSGEVIWSVPASTSVWKIDLVPDLSGSGLDDIVVGDFHGNVTVHDGLDGQVVWSAAMPDQAFSVAAIGDITQDGYTEIAVGTANSQVRLLSGADGSTVWSYQVGNGTIQQAADEVFAIPDVDGNNAPEIAIGSRHGWLTLLKSTSEVLPVAGETDALTRPFSLHAPYPNPTRADVEIPFSLSREAAIEIAIYDVLGRRVATVLEGERGAGAHGATWDGRGLGGSRVATGLYIVRLQTGGDAAWRRLIVLR